jgi:hypothetical protein
MSSATVSGTNRKITLRNEPKLRKEHSGNVVSCSIKLCGSRRTKERLSMKNTIKLNGIIALAVALTFAACGGDGDGGGGGGGGGGSGLTITGLPSGNYSVWVFTSGADISTYKKFNAAIAAGHCEAQGTSLSNNNVFDYLVIKSTADPYTGSGNKQVYLQQGLQDRYATVSFSNGSATVQFSSFTNAVMD